MNVAWFSGGNRYNAAAGHQDGDAATALFNSPLGLAADGEGNVFVADSSNQRIRKVTSDGTVSTFAGSGGAGHNDGQGAAAQFHGPSYVAVDGEGNVFVSELQSHRIRKITPEGMVSTFAGSQAGFQDGQGTAALFHSPRGLAADGEGNVFVADHSNHRIRKITPDGAVSTIAGSGGAGHNDGQGTGAQFYSPLCVAVDLEGNVFVSEPQHHRIRKITPEGMVSTFAGASGQADFQDGQGTAARFHSPQGLAADGEGNVFVADHSNHCLRKITPDGAVSTIAGDRSGNMQDGEGTAASFQNLHEVAVDDQGDIVVIEGSHHCLRRVQAGLVPLSASAIKPVPSTYVEEMKRKLRDAEALFADVNFVVKYVDQQQAEQRSEPIFAHRAQLASRSDYFKTMFTTAVGDSAAGRPLEIGDTTPSAFRAILEYLYTDQLEFDDADIVDVMRKAHEMSLTRVYNFCVLRCRRHMSVHNAIIWFVNAHVHQLEDLRETGKKYIARNFRRIRTEARGTLQLLGQHPELMMEVMVDAL